MATRFNFAWVNASETTFGPEHQRGDEKIVRATIEQAEGEFAAMTLTVRNPRIGLLAPGRKTWAWFSYGATPLFFGRLVGVPENMLDELVTLVFSARPSDFVAQKEVLAEALRVLPNFDPVFISPEMVNDPDTVLEAYPMLWHIDRVTHEVTTSHILNGEDGVEVFEVNDVPRDSVKITLDQVPTRRVVVDAAVTWDQAATGSLSIPEAKRTTLTFGGKSLIDEWPKTDKSLGGGWKVIEGVANDDLEIDATEVLSTGVHWSNPAKKHATGDTMSMDIAVSRAPVRGDSISLLVTSRNVSNTGEAGVDSTSLRIPEWQVSTDLKIGYDASRGRKEHIRFTLAANMQAIVTLPGEDEVLRLNVNGADVGVPLVIDGSTEPVSPIADAARRSYFTTDRGLRSLEYLILLAVARLLMASRAVEIEFGCHFERAIALSCRKSATLNDPRLPGGTATGKVKSYRIDCDGDAGSIIGSVTIGCPIGYGGTVEEVPGEPTYVTEGYVSRGYQKYQGGVTVLDSSVGYTMPTDAPADDGLIFPLRRSDVVLNAEWIGSNAAQRAAILAAGVIPDTRFNPPLLANMVDDIFDAAKEIPKRVEDALAANPIYFDLQLRGLEGQFEQAFDIDLTTLEIPQGINLEGGLDGLWADDGTDFYIAAADGDDAPLMWD